MMKKAVPVKMTAKQSELILEAIAQGQQQSYNVEDWQQLQDILKQVKTVPQRIELFYEE